MFSYEKLIYLFCSIDSAILAHFMLKEKLRKMGIFGCVLCVVGSTIIMLHAPGEHAISSVDEIWRLATQPGKCTLPTGIWLIFVSLIVHISLNIRSSVILLCQLSFYTRLQQSQLY